MNLKVEHGIIALLLLAILYYFFKHQSLLSDLLRVPDKGNPQLKMVKGKHSPTEMEMRNHELEEARAMSGHGFGRGFTDG